MKIRHILWITAGLVGAVVGATGSRSLITAPEAENASNLAIPELLLSVACFQLIAWLFAFLLGKYSQHLLIGVVALGAYVVACASVEMIFGVVNGKVMLSSLGVFLFGCAILLSCFISKLLFRRRVSAA
ncbi:hypothetical protein ACW5F0_14460 [Luteimonas sp. A534]